MAVIFMLTKRNANNSLFFDMTKDLLSQLKHDYPELRFIDGKKYAFRPPRTIILESKDSRNDYLLLHEVAHAICKHIFFKTDVERLRMESEAWEKAKELALRYNVKIDEDLIQDELDTYRNWLHRKSRCPNCGLTRFQTSDGQYHCPQCNNN